MKQKGLALIVIVIFIAVVLGLGGFLIYTQQTKSSETTNQASYVPGEVIVTFNDNTTYKQAKDLLNRFSISNFENSYWSATNKTPTDKTLLSRVDIIKIKTTPGKEGELINKLSKESIIRTATKNYLLQITQ